MSDPMSFFTENVDRWGAAEWFDRLAKAIREQDKAVVENNHLAFDTYKSIAASSAMTLVRDFEQEVRAALQNPAPETRAAVPMSETTPVSETDGAAISERVEKPQCCMCGKKGLSTVEGDAGTECELKDGRWVCSMPCWDQAVEPPVNASAIDKISDDEIREIAESKDTASCRARIYAALLRASERVER